MNDLSTAPSHTGTRNLLNSLFVCSFGFIPVPTSAFYLWSRLKAKMKKTLKVKLQGKREMGVWKSTSHNEIYIIWSQKSWWIICWQSIFHSGIHTPFPNTTTSNSRLCLQASCYMHAMLMWTAQIHHMYRPSHPLPCIYIYIYNTYNTSPYRGRWIKCVTTNVSADVRDSDRVTPQASNISTPSSQSVHSSITQRFQNTQSLKAFIWRLFHCHVRQKGPPLPSAVMK